MSAETFGVIEAAGYVTAAVLLMATLVFFFTRHVREVHDELTGKAARAAIEGLRQGGGIARPAAGAGAGVAVVGFIEPNNTPPTRRMPSPLPGGA